VETEVVALVVEETGAVALVVEGAGAVALVVEETEAAALVVEGTEVVGLAVEGIKVVVGIVETEGTEVFGQEPALELMQALQEYIFESPVIILQADPKLKTLPPPLVIGANHFTKLSKIPRQLNY